MVKKTYFAMQGKIGQKCIKNLPLSIFAPTYLEFYIWKARTRILSSFFIFTLTVLQCASKILDVGGSNPISMFLMSG